MQHRIESCGFNVQRLSQNSSPQIPHTPLCCAATSAEVISKHSHWIGIRWDKFKTDGFMIQVPKQKAGLPTNPVANGTVVLWSSQANYTQ